jgi:hypothetical protein
MIDTSLGSRRLTLLPPKFPPPSPVKIPQISVPDLRNLLTFMGGVVSSVQAEAEVERETGTQFIYLLDFDTIFDYIAPYLRGRSDHSTLANFLSTAEFFEGLEENFAIPLGTFLEISQFLKGRMDSFKHLHSVTLSTSMDAAIQNLEAYFQGDRFAAGRTSNAADPSELTEEERLAVAQIEAVKLLSDSEQGLRRLYSLLTHQKLFNVFELIARHPFRFPWDAYNDVRAALEAMRSGGAKQSANKADAYNITFANELNSHLRRRVKEGRLKNPFFFRLLTNTRTIHRLSGTPDLSIRFHVRVDTGHTFDLLDGTEEATAKRILRKLRTGERLKEVIDFGERRDRAAAALGHIVDAAFHQKQPVEALIHRIQNIQSIADREVGINLQRHIKDLDAFFRPDYLFVHKLIDNRVRKDLIPEIGGSDRQREIQAPAAADLSLLENLVTSTQRVLAEIDTLGFELTAIQSGDDSKQWVNPIMSLERLEYKAETSSSPGVERWRVTHGRSGRVTFCADRLRDGWSMYWPTQVSGANAIGFLLSALGPNVDPLDVVTLRLIDFKGNERSSSVSFSALSVTEEEMADVAFLRLEARHLIFVSELFSPARHYTLMTGIIMMDRIPDADLLNRLFGIFGKERKNLLFCRLLNIEFFRWMERFLP